MSANSEILGNHGTKHSFVHGGKTFEMQYLTRKVKGAFEKALFRRDREMAETDQKPFMTKEEYAEHLDKLNADFRAGEYALMSKAGQKYLSTVDGQLLLASLLCGCDEDTMFEVIAAKPQEMSALIKLVIEESLPNVPKNAPAEEPVPNAEAPAAT